MTKYKTAAEILDAMIKVMPKTYSGTAVLFMSADLYKKLCLELNRSVRTYKKFKVVADLTLTEDSAILTNK